MTMTDFFTKDHRQIDSLFAAFRGSLAQGRPDGALLSQVQQRLHHHIYWEEELLSPEVEARGIQGPTQVMAAEHGEICSLLDRLGNLLRKGTGVPEMQRTLDLLEGHREGHRGAASGIHVTRPQAYTPHPGAGGGGGFCVGRRLLRCGYPLHHQYK